MRLTSRPHLSQLTPVQPLAVLKWVIDDSAVEQVGTAEEMAAALQVVAAGEVAQLPGQATPAGISTEVSTPVPLGTGSGTATPAVVGVDLVPAVPTADKPAEGPAPDETMPSVEDAVKELQEAPVEGLVGEEDVKMGEPKPFVEDEVQVAQEATQGMVGMTQPEVVEGTA